MEAENPIFILINFVVIYTRAVLYYHILIQNDFFYIVKWFLPLKVNVKYNILNTWFGYKEYLSYWRVSSVVDTCANAISQLLLQVLATYGRDCASAKALETISIKFIYGRRT